MDAPRESKFGFPLPGARDVSLTVSQGLELPSPARNFLFVVFGQFVDHDLTVAPLAVLAVDNPTGKWPIPLLSK